MASIITVYWWVLAQFCSAIQGVSLPSVPCMLALAPVPAVFLHRHKRVIMIEELRVIFPRSCSTTTATDAQHGDTTVGICIKPGELSPVNTAVSSVTSHRNIFNIQKLWKMHFVAGWVCDIFFFSRKILRGAVMPVWEGGFGENVFERWSALDTTSFTFCSQTSLSPFSSEYLQYKVSEKSQTLSVQYTCTSQVSQGEMQRKIQKRKKINTVTQSQTEFWILLTSCEGV